MKSATLRLGRERMKEHLAIANRFLEEL